MSQQPSVILLLMGISSKQLSESTTPQVILEAHHGQILRFLDFLDLSTIANPIGHSSSSELMLLPKANETWS